MKIKGCGKEMLRGAAMKLGLGLAVSALLSGGLNTPARAQAPSFTFTATIPSQVVAGSAFTVPASITDVGGQAVDYNSFFQLYDQNFNYVSQTFYTNQTFQPGQTLNYNVTFTAPSKPGAYFVAALMFNQDFTGGIINQEFFLPTFNVVAPAAVPEPSHGVAIGLLLVGALVLKARQRGLRV